MRDIQFGDGSDVSPCQLEAFYGRVKVKVPGGAEQMERMLDASSAFVTARINGELIGIARGVSDGARGYLTECKLDPAYQGPGAVTRTDGRIEDDTHGIAAEMARRVLQKLHATGVQRVDVVAWGTEEDFLAELGFRRAGGMVGMTMRSAEMTTTDAAMSAATA